MKKRYFTENNKLFNFINNKKYKIIKIKTIKKYRRNNLFIKSFISSYCVFYEIL